MSMKKHSTLIIIIIIITPTSSSIAFSNKDKAYNTIMRWTMPATVMEDGASVSAILLL
jgi:hypothetical protein